MSESTDIADVELSALVDGELRPERHAALEARIAADPALKARFEGYRADKEMLRRLFAPLADRPVPQEWLARAYVSRTLVSWRLVGSIAAALLIGVIGTLSYFELRPSSAGGVVEQALDARSDIERPERIVAVEAGTDVTLYDALLKSAVKTDVRVPDLAKMGYRLTGIRVFTRGAAELVYRDNADRIFTLYVRRSDGTARFDQFERDGLRVCIWQDDVLAMVAAGNMSTAAMQRLASLAYTGLTL